MKLFKKVNIKMKPLNEKRNTVHKSTKFEFCYISAAIVCVCFYFSGILQFLVLFILK